jgi:hypothetical protein
MRPIAELRQAVSRELQRLLPWTPGYTLLLSCSVSNHALTNTLCYYLVSGPELEPLPLPTASIREHAVGVLVAPWTCAACGH